MLTLMLASGTLSSATDMSYMFYGTSVADPDVSAWNTENVTNLAGYVHEC